MASSFQEEHNQKLIRERLNRDQIKLWLIPYTAENGEKGEQPKDLINRYSQDLKLGVAEVSAIIETLRQHSVQKLAERNEFNKDGVATLKLKLPPSHSENSKKQVVSVKLKLQETGLILREKVGELCGIPIDRIKLISAGIIITDSKSLQEQKIKNGSQIMTVLLSVTELEAVQKEKQVEDVNKTRKAAELLSVRAANDDTKYDVQIADQSGRPLKLPKEEKQALTLAMTLHEKGRSLLKQKNISSALLLLIEADTEFKKCRASILDAVDNYAVLCLDIVWCYLCLKNLDQLPDAERRLKACEECLIRSYGSHMERLTAVKGESSTAMVLFMKLHLLQGIIAFHQHNIDTAKTLLKQAEDDIKRLSVDPELITQVMSMGFNEREARLGLRACDGNIPQTCDYIIKVKKEKEEIMEKVKGERENRKKVRQYGRTSNGDWLNASNLEMLLKMGYRKGPAVEGLRQANNDVTLALDVLNNKPELLNLPDPTDEDLYITDDMITQLTVLGFLPEMCRRALIKNHGDNNKAAEELLQSDGFIPTITCNTSPSSSSCSSSESTSESESEMLNELVSDIKQEGDEYLDVNLEDEKQFLEEYQSLLKCLSSK
ncbi:hypothetical protein LOTGIDRAFT_224600 [Lottia gigantea]|uniref:NEDD8 ultimate buster 1 n=1 Tax=Lottia gigantea TaxID=225164 RepID=V4BB15_LOTGI|nr:hypothetical protein LOTGIDRAFT_224600 [Lottia gigantea]ESP03187.1 hypothetical protein LOTGIDRAFT_224600 [Lottia gigantea]